MQGFTGKDLSRCFETVRRNTIQLAEEIPEEQYGYRAAPGIRSVGEMLAHIAAGHVWQQQIHSDGVSFVDFERFGAMMQNRGQREASLDTKAKIVAALQQGGADHTAWLAGLSDEVLAQVVSFPPPVNPPTKTRFEMLLSLKEHEMHHRAQLMLVQRIIGIVPHLTRNFQAAMAARQQAQGQPA